MLNKIVIVLKSFFVILFRKISQKIHLVLLFVLALNLIFGLIFFWRYGFSQKIKESPNESQFVLNQGFLDNFSKKYAENTVDFQKISKETYPDSFNRDFFETTPNTTTTPTSSPGD